MARSSDATVELRVDYRVAAARWAPSYLARLDGDHATIEVRAVVAQRTGEDWGRAVLRLSTAEPEQFAAILPELAPQRIGRRQESPSRSGFRPAPGGAEALYADYLRVARTTIREEAPRLVPADPSLDDLEDDGDTLVGAPATFDKKRAITQEVWDEQSSRAKAAFRTPPDGTRAYNAPAPAPTMSRARGTVVPNRADDSLPMPMMGYGGGAALGAPPMPDKPKPAPGPPPPRLDYGNLVMAPPGSRRAVTLVPARASPSARKRRSLVEVGAGIAAVTALALPPGCVGAWAQAYDYAFTADGAVDVASDGAWHALAITAKPATVKVRHVAVPREQADVFRVAAIANPHAAPLLPGPIDVYDHGTFLITSEVALTPPGAMLELGLGVDPTVKIARNAEFHEEATGVLRGGLRLVHAIAIDVENLSGRAVDVEVRERVPVVRDGDDTVEVAVGRVEPAWERWTPDPDAPADQRLRGGQRWRVQLPAGAKKQLRAAYEIRIASKLELVGGNRRES